MPDQEMFDERMFKNHLDRFNPQRAFELIEKSKESGGSWFYNAGISSHRFSSSESVVPATAIDNYGKLTDLKSIQATTLSAGGGGAYSFVFKEKWVASALLGLSLGSQWVSAKYTNDREQRNILSSKSILKAGFGYSGEKFLGGIYSTYDNTVLTIHSAELNLATVSFQSFLGWRF